MSKGGFMSKHCICVSVSKRGLKHSLDYSCHQRRVDTANLGAMSHGLEFDCLKNNVNLVPVIAVGILNN